MPERQNTTPLPAHHRPGGGFRNPWPKAQSHGFLDFLKWSLERRRKPRAPEPDPNIFTRVPSAFIVPRGSPSNCTITWVGHSSFLIQIAGLNVLTDPVWSERASPVSFVGPKRWVSPAIAFNRLPPIDVVIVSHDHYDHLDAPTVSRLAARYPAIAWYVPLGVGKFLRKRGAREILETDWWEERKIAGLKLTCIPAQHFSGRTLGSRNTTLWCGWSLVSASHSILFGGDTALHPEFGSIARRCGPFDLAILPIGAYEPRWFMGSVHMNPDDCVSAFGAIKAVQGKRLKMVAAHWGTFKLTDEPMDEPPRRIQQLWRTHGLADDDLWILRHGETRMIRK